MKRMCLLATLIFLLTSTGAFCQQIKGTFAIENVETGVVLRIKDANTKNGTPSIVAYSPVNCKCVTGILDRLMDKLMQGMVVSDK